MNLYLLLLDGLLEVNEMKQFQSCFVNYMVKKGRTFMTCSPLLYVYGVSVSVFD
jgi:hypothetical protein